MLRNQKCDAVGLFRALQRLMANGGKAHRNRDLSHAAIGKKARQPATANWKLMDASENSFTKFPDQVPSMLVESTVAGRVLAASFIEAEVT